jgi:hypothetical protein
VEGAGDVVEDLEERRGEEKREGRRRRRRCQREYSRVERRKRKRQGEEKTLTVPSGRTISVAARTKVGSEMTWMALEEEAEEEEEASLIGAGWFRLGWVAWIRS